MTAILYPVAANAEQAFSRPLGRQAREKEATALAEAPVTFVTEALGPAFSTREAALDAYQGRVEDERSGFTPAHEDRYCRLAEQRLKPTGKPMPPVEPVFEDGRRWPKPTPPPPTVWRLIVSYWRIVSADELAAAPQARQIRKSGGAVDPETLQTIARQPLRAVKPQQPLDIGLFEIRPPEAPHIVMPDE